MRIGLIADIHEHVINLTNCLNALRAAQVDRIVVLGDVFETGQSLEPTCQLLVEAGAVGVWGNHDFGLCHQPQAELSDRYSKVTREFMQSLQPRLEIEGVMFQHVEPWLDPTKLEDLWFYEGPPSDTQRLRRIFASTVCRFIFVGHYHRWLLASPESILDWQAATTFQFNEGRYFVSVAALCDGRFAILDSEQGTLVPLEI